MIKELQKRKDCFFILEAFKGVNSLVHTEKELRKERNVENDIAL